MKTYYWEGPVDSPDCGRFGAKNDAEALAKMPKDSICLYRESNTKDGLPFVFLYDHKHGKKK